MISFKTRGNYNKTKKHLNDLKNIDISSILDKYGRLGVRRFKDATPVRTGLTSESWDYHIEKTKHGQKLVFTNSNIQDECHVVILIRYGHVTSSGTWIEGNDFISPILNELCEEIKSEM